MVVFYVTFVFMIFTSLTVIMKNIEFEHFYYSLAKQQTLESILYKNRKKTNKLLKCSKKNSTFSV